MEKLKIKIEEATDSVSRLENIAYLILLVASFLIPIFFIPSATFPFQFSKVVFISVATIIALVLWIIARLKDGRFILPNNLVFLGTIGVLLTSFVSAMLSPVVATSILGAGFEVGSWSNLLVMFSLLFLFAVLFRPKERVFYLYLVLFCAFFIIVAFHILRFIFGADFLSFGLFTTITSNLIGKWNDLGIFFALVTVLAMITLELLPLNRLFKSLVYVIFCLSLSALIIVNFSTIWYALLAASVVFGVYSFVFGREFKHTQNNLSDTNISTETASRKRRGLSVLACVTALVAIIFLVESYTEARPISTKIANQFGISHLEVRPNWDSTLYVAKKTLSTHTLFGSGLNRFTAEWLANKPSGINESIFWNTDFSYGIGFLPTIFVTSGFVGGLAWLLFLAAIIRLGSKAILSPVSDKRARYLLVSSLFASLFLWVFFIFYIPSGAVVSLTFLFTGIFLASSYNDKIIKARVISFDEDPKMNFISVLVLVALLVGSVALGFVLSKKFVAVAYFQKAVIAANVEGNIDMAGIYADKALSLSKNSSYYQFLSDVILMKISNLLANPTSASVDAVREEFQTLFGKALGYARDAVEFDDTDYQNWVALGRVYEAVVPLNIEGAYESADAAYTSAVARNPYSPILDLSRARLEFAKKDNAKAMEHIGAALLKKRNYTEALFLKSQIEASAGDLDSAIASVEDATLLAPNDHTVSFQLGVLKYNNKDYRGAVEAFERALTILPTYANAKYFLGLSYERLGRDVEALVQFNDILTLNPGNQDVERIIANVSAGKDPFFDASTAELPENRDTLPIEEDGVKAES